MCTRRVLKVCAGFGFGAGFVPSVRGRGGRCLAQSSSRLAAERHARFTPVARASDLGDSSRRTSSFTSEGNASKRSNDVDGPVWKVVWKVLVLVRDFDPRALGRVQGAVESLQVFTFHALARVQPDRRERRLHLPYRHTVPYGRFGRRVSRLRLLLLDDVFAHERRFLIRILRHLLFRWWWWWRRRVLDGFARGRTDAHVYPPPGRWRRSSPLRRGRRRRRRRRRRH